MEGIHMKKKIIIPILIIIVVGVVACLRLTNSNKTVYKYGDNSKQSVASKTEYHKNKLIVYTDIELSDNANLRGVYDKDFKRIQAPADFKLKNGKITITCDEAECISGFEIGDYSWNYSFRYLDSDHCAVLVESWADDAGWMVSSGSDEYYTTAEKAEQNAREQAIEEKMQQAFDQVKGMWYSEDKTMYMNFYIDENGYRRVETFYNEYYENGEKVIGGYSASSISIEESAEGKYIAIDESMGYTVTTTFELSDDMKQLTNRENGEPIIFYKE